MKKILAVLEILLATAIPLFAGTIPMSGTIRLANGNLFTGSVRFILSYSAAQDFNAGNIVVASTVQYPVNNGVLPSNAKITPNDTLSPANTWYTAQYINPSGALVAQNTFYITGQSFNLGTATPTPVTTSNISFNTFNNLDSITVKSLDNRKMCDSFPGANAGAKMANCMAAVSNTGGIADASGIQGAGQACTSDPFTGVTKPVLLIWPATQVSCTTSLTVPANVTVEFTQGGILSMATATTATVNGGITGTMDQHFAGAGNISIPSTYVPQVYPQWWGAKGKGADETAPVQAAIDAVSPIFTMGGPNIGAGKVFFPSGQYLITTTIDATNSRVVGTHSRDGLTLAGEGVSSQLLGQTGAGHAIIETTGSQYLRMQQLWLDTTVPVSGQSTLGILQGVEGSGANQQTQNQQYEQIFINMHDAPTANANVGTVGIWNFGSEENTYTTMWVRANVAVILTSVNDGVNQPGPFTLISYQSLATGHSLGLTTFSGENFLNGLQKRNAPIIIQNITALSGENVYVADTTGGAGSQKAGIYFYGNCTNCKLHGSMEVLSSIQMDGACVNCDISYTYGGVDATSTGIVLVNRLKANFLLNSTFHFDVEADFSRPVVTTVDGDEMSTSSYYIENTTFDSFNANASLPSCYIPANVKANAGTVLTRACFVFPSTDIFLGGPAVTTGNNVTGDGTTYSLNGQAFTVLVNNNSALDPATGIFTATFTGNYEFMGAVSIANATTSDIDDQVFVFAGGNQYQLARGNPGSGLVNSTEYDIGGSVIIPLTAGNTAYLQVKVSGSSKTIAVASGDATVGWRTRFGGKFLY